MTATLTPRQRQLCDLLCAGKTADEAAAELGMKHNTMRHHVRNLRKALGVRRLSEIVEVYSGGQATYRQVHRGGRKAAAWLTPAELRIFQVAARGLSWVEVCKVLGKSRNTVSRQMAGAYRKLGVRNRTAALIELGFLKRDPSVVELSEPFEAELDRAAHELDVRTLPYAGYEAKPAEDA